MKNKILYVFFTVAVLLCCFAFSAFAGLDIEKDDVENLDQIKNLYECISKGDVDGNEKVDANDARIILRASVYLETLDDEASLKADIDGNGRISADDARLALRLAVGLDKLPTHDVHEIVIVSATCSTEGLTVKICKSCMKIYAKITVPASTDRHIPGAWKTTVAPTCIDKGLKQIKCLACNTLINEAEILATGEHSGEWSYPDGKSCYDYVEKTRTCTVCGANETKVENPTLKHSYKWITEKKNTCTEEGFQVNKCSHCGETNPNEENKVLKALGHEYDSSDIIEAATCTETGLKEGICAFCGPVTEEIPALGHKVAKWNTVKKSSCAEAGLKEGTCSVCKKAVTSEIAKIKHNFNEKVIHWTDGIPCEGTGIGYIECTKCNEKQDVQIKKVSCTNKEPGGKDTRVVTEATCTEAKTSIDVCDYCKKDIAGTQKSTGKPLGHTAGEYKIKEHPTCALEGREEAICTACKQIVATRPIEKIAHTPEQIIISDSGEEIAGNYVVKCKIICTVCDETLSEEETITKIAVAGEFTVKFNDNININAGGLIEFTITDAAENMLVLISNGIGGSEKLIAENGTYSYTIPSTFGPTDMLIIQIFALPN